MAFNFKSAFISQSPGSAAPHYSDHQTARTLDGDPVYEWRNGGVAKARVVYRSAISGFAMQSDRIEEFTLGAGITFGHTLHTAGLRPSADNASDLGVSGTNRYRNVYAVNFVGGGASLTSLNASNLASGTVPDARFPATLPAVSGVNLTGLNASNLGSGTVPSARVSGAYGGITGVGTLVSGTVPAPLVSSGQFGTGRYVIETLTGTQPTYGTGQLELKSGGANPVALGFHRPGFTACALVHAGDGLELHATTWGSRAALTVGDGRIEGTLTVTGVSALHSNAVLRGADVTADGGVRNSVDLVLRGYYDSDATVGVLSTKLDFSLRNVVSNGSTYRLAIFNNAGTEIASIGQGGALTASSFAGGGSGLTSLNASNLASGTVPDARFPATLPAASGVNLTSLNASNLGSGTVPSVRVSGAYGGITGVGTLTAGVWNATAIDGAYLTGSPSFTNVTAGGTLAVTGVSTLTGDVVASVIRRATADGADNSSLAIAGGGAVGESRGAFIQLFGNEAAVLPGELRLGAGLGGAITFRANSAERLQINPAGNIGFGTADVEAWLSDYKVLQGPVDAITLHNTGELQFWNNAYNDGVSLKYRTTGAAGRYAMVNGGHTFYVAPSGTIDTAITWTTALTIANSGAATFNSSVTASSFSGSGASLTSLNASNLGSGTVPSARVSGSYTGITAVGTLTSLAVSGALTAASLNLGGATVTDVLSGTLAITATAIPAGGEASFTITVTGAAAGDPVFVGIDTFQSEVDGANNLYVWAMVDAADSVRVRVRNHGSNEDTVNAQTIRAVVFKF
jgi:hypothetical protein